MKGACPSAPLALCSRRSGFTLIEVLVALTLTGLVVLIAHAILAEVSDTAERGQAVAEELDRAGNRRGWLTRALANTTVNTAPARGFEGRDGWDGDGEADRIAFYARLPSGPNDADRRIRLWRDGTALMAEVAPASDSGAAKPDTLILAEELGGFGADFLVEYGASVSWVREWISPVSAPVAVRLRLLSVTGRADTVLLHVGTRG